MTPGGLERNLIEHIFDHAGLPVKTDYVEIPSRDEYPAAFMSGHIDAVVAPQPVRSRLLAAVSGSTTFDADSDVPRCGLYAPFAYRRSEWTLAELSDVQRAFLAAASELAQLDDDALR